MDRQITPSLNDKKKPRIYYGYVVLAACFFIMTFVSGAQCSYGVFFKPMLNEFGWTRASTSGPFSLNMVLGGLLSIIAGRLSDRFGPRIVVTFGGIILGSGFLLMSRINNLWQLYLTFGIIVAVGLSTMYIPLVAMVTRWFPKKRGLMVGIGISGVGFGIGVVPMIASQFIISFNWRTSLLIIGAASLISIVLLAQLLRAVPEATSSDNKRDTEADVPIHAKGLSFRESIKTRQFWMIFVAWILYGYFYQIGMVHIVPYATDLGMSALAAATVLMIIGLAGVCGRIVLGFTGDRFSNKNTLLISFILLTLAFIGISASGTVGILYVFAFFFGFFSGVGILLTPITAEYFGFEALGMISGAIMFANNFGGTISPTLAGYIFDTTGNYRLAFISCGICGIAAIITISLLKSASRH